MDGGGIEVGVGGEGGGKVGPPLGEEAFGDDSEPGGPEQAGGGVHEFFKLRQGDVLSGVDFIGVALDGEGGGGDLEEEDVVYFVLAPFGRGAVGDCISCPVMQAGQELEFFNGHLRGRDTELVFELADGRAFDALDCAGGDVLGGVDFGGAEAAQGVGAAGVRPNLGEGNLGCGALLQQETAGLVKEEDGEGPVELAAGLFGREAVAVVLVFRAQELVLIVDHQAFVLAHEIVLAHARAFAPIAVGPVLLLLLYMWGVGCI